MSYITSLYLAFKPPPKFSVSLNILISAGKSATPSSRNIPIPSTVIISSSVFFSYRESPSTGPPHPKDAISMLRT
ncbi:MAG: hypothetical protein RR838_02495 [Clostridium sp.]